MFELYVRNQFPLNDEVNVSCENTMNFPNSCDIFSLKKNALKSSKNDWYGTIRIMKKLSLLENSLFQFIIIASVIKFYIIRITID